MKLITALSSFSHNDLVLHEIRRQDTFLLQDVHGFQGYVEAAIQARERIVGFGFHELSVQRISGIAFVSQDKCLNRKLPPVETGERNQRAQVDHA